MGSKRKALRLYRIMKLVNSIKTLNYNTKILSYVNDLDDLKSIEMILICLIQIRVWPG